MLDHATLTTPLFAQTAQMALDLTKKETVKDALLDVPAVRLPVAIRALMDLKL